MLNLFVCHDLYILNAVDMKRLTQAFSIVGHLHAGNIIVEDNRIKLLDLENWLLGLPSYYRCYITQLKKINVSTALSCVTYVHIITVYQKGQLKTED